MGTGRAVMRSRHQKSRFWTSRALVTMKSRRAGDVVAHQDRGDHVGLGGLVDRDLQQRARLVIHRGGAQLFPVHLAEALQALELLLVVRAFLEECILGDVVLQVDLLLADFGGVQRRLGDVAVARLDHLAHLAEEEREQQRADVAAVDVGVGEAITLWYRHFSTSNSSPTPAPMAVISAWISLFFSILSMRARSTLRILPRIGRIACVRGSRASTAVPPAESPSTMKISDSSAFFDEQSFSLSGMPAPDRAVLRRMALRAFFAAARACAAARPFLTILLASAGFSSIHSAEPLRRWPSARTNAPARCRAWPWSGPRTAARAP